MSKLDRDLVSKAVDKILAFSKGQEVDGQKGKVRNFTESIELQVSPSSSSGASEEGTGHASTTVRQVYRRAGINSLV